MLPHTGGFANFKCKKNAKQSNGQKVNLHLIRPFARPSVTQVKLWFLNTCHQTDDSPCFASSRALRPALVPSSLSDPRPAALSSINYACLQVYCTAVDILPALWDAAQFVLKFGLDPLTSVSTSS